MKLVPPSVFFESIARRYDRAYALDAPTTRARMKRLLPALPSPPSSLLDLGVGTGREVGALQDAGYAVTGLDASPAMLALCARRARPIPLVEADLWGPLPFPDASFDAAIALHGTLAHPPDRAAYARLAAELARVLRAGGAFVAEVPAQAWVRQLGARGVEDGDARIVRISDDTLLHEDTAAGIAVEATVPSDDAWQATFRAHFDVTCEALGDAETLVIARRFSSSAPSP